MGNWVCPQVLPPPGLGLDLGPAGRPSPALPQDAWRWIEITSQKLTLSCSPLGPKVASGFPVYFLARRIFYPLSSELGHSRVCLTLAYLGASVRQLKSPS